MSKLLKKEKGFTLIEVVIVLAIGALIILIVLQAVQSAQRANRDAARKTEAGRMVSLLTQYSSNNNGLYPSTAAIFGTAMSTYDTNLHAKYQGAAATTAGAGMTGTTCGTPASNNYTVIYAPVTGNRDYTLQACLESGGAVNIQH